MKKTLIGCCLTIIGTLSFAAISICASLNLVSGWSTPPGRFLTTILETDLTLPFTLSVLLLALGLIILGVEYFRREP